MITIREAQNKTGLSDAAIRRHIKSGRIQAAQTADGKYLIEESELVKLPNPRNRLPHQKIDEREVPQGVPFPVTPRREEIILKALENERVFLDLMKQNRAMVSMI